MTNANDIDIKLRRCQPFVVPPHFAREERWGVITVITVLWGLYLGMLFKRFGETNQLKIPWAHIDSELAFELGLGLLGVLLSRKLIGYAQQLVSRAEELANDGVPATGQIIDRWQLGTATRPREFIAYRFDYQGMVWIGEQLATQPPYNLLQIGDNILIRLTPQNPRVCGLQPATDETAHKPRRLKVAAPHRATKLHRQISIT